MSEIIYDKIDQMRRVMNHIVPGETLYAVYDMKGEVTGFVGITDLRLIFMDESFVRKAISLISVPYTKITVVGSVDEKGIVFSTSKLMKVAGAKTWEFEFRTSEKAHKAYELIMLNLLQTEARGM